MNNIYYLRISPFQERKKKYFCLNSYNWQNKNVISDYNQIVIIVLLFVLLSVASNHTALYN